MSEYLSDRMPEKCQIECHLVGITRRKSFFIDQNLGFWIFSGIFLTTKEQDWRIAPRAHFCLKFWLDEQMAGRLVKVAE